MKASAECANKLQEILALYELQPGQMVNKDESSAFFSKGIRQNVKVQVLQSLRIPRESQKLKILRIAGSSGCFQAKRV